MLCLEKVVRLTLPNVEAMIIYRDKLGQNLKLISCAKSQKYLHKKYYAFLAHIVDKTKKMKEIKDIHHVCDYPEVFPEDMPGLPPSRIVKFRINLIPAETLVARPPIDWLLWKCKRFQVN